MPRTHSPPLMLGPYDNSIIFRPSSMAEVVHKPTSKTISVSPCLRVLRVNRPEATPPLSMVALTTVATSCDPPAVRPRLPGGTQFIASTYPRRTKYPRYLVGPARNVPAPPSARGVRTGLIHAKREGRAPARPCTGASGRLTRSARRHEDTESGFEVGVCAVSSTTSSREWTTDAMNSFHASAA